MTPVDDARRRLVEFQTAQAAAVEEAVAAYESHDVVGFIRKLERAIDQGVVEQVMRAIGRTSAQATPAFRAAFLDYWIDDSSSIREAGRDAILLTALWKLMPPYRGPSIDIWRGETAYNRRYRSYGMSWTASEAVARRFAGDMRALSEGGSVLLRTLAPAYAIICAPAIVSNGLEEDEFIVDRRRLGPVHVMERFAAAQVK